MSPLHDKFISLIRGMTYENAQNKLMACTDREIAVVMLHMEENERDFIFSFLAHSKSGRIKEEIRLLKKTKVTYEQYTLILSRLIKRLKGNGEGPQRRSYLKPRKKYR